MDSMCALLSLCSTPCLQFSSVQLFSHVQLFATPWTAAHQASLLVINSQSVPKLMRHELVMPSNHLILCHPLLLLPSIFSNIRVFSNESVLRIRWPKYWSFSFNISPSNERPGLTSFRMEYYSTIKRNTFESVLMRWMNLEPIQQSEVSQKDKYCILMHILEKEMATHSSVLAWIIPRMEDPGRLPSME